MSGLCRSVIRVRPGYSRSCSQDTTTPARRPATPRSPSPARPRQVTTPPAVPAVPMVPMQGSTSMMWLSLTFPHMYVMGDLLLFHI